MIRSLLEGLVGLSSPIERFGMSTVFASVEALHKHNPIAGWALEQTNGKAEALSQIVKENASKGKTAAQIAKTLVTGEVSAQVESRQAEIDAAAKAKVEKILAAAKAEKAKIADEAFQSVMPEAEKLAADSGTPNKVEENAARKAYDAAKGMLQSALSSQGISEDDVVGLLVEPVTSKTTRTLNNAAATYAGGATASDVKTWAKENGFEVSDKGRISGDVVKAFESAHSA